MVPSDQQTNIRGGGRQAGGGRPACADRTRCRWRCPSAAARTGRSRRAGRASNSSTGRVSAWREGYGGVVVGEEALVVEEAEVEGVEVAVALGVGADGLPAEQFGSAPDEAGSPIADALDDAVLVRHPRNDGQQVASGQQCHQAEQDYNLHLLLSHQLHHRPLSSGVETSNLPWIGCQSIACLLLYSLMVLRLQQIVMNERKRGLLQKQVAQPEWIMLEDITPQPQKKKYSSPDSHAYARLQDTHPQDKMTSPPHQNRHKIEEIPMETAFNPKIITINGDTFKQVQPEQERQGQKQTGESRKKKSKVPQMHVACFYCTCVQSVPATSERFTCGHCGNQNKCSPLYRIFLCGTCKAKVLYATGSSDLIKCTRCSAVNKVPLAHGNPYEVQYRVASSLDREERETDPFREECLEISELGAEEEWRFEDFKGYLGEK